MAGVHRTGERVGARAVLGAVLTLVVAAACDPTQRAGDTQGEQRMARWEWSGGLVADTDPVLTLVRLRVDTTGVVGRHDVILARYDFDPTDADGDEYALTVGLDLGRARELRMNTPIPIGPPPAPVLAVGTVTCLCRPLRPDSVRGTFLIAQRGLRQITARIDATLYFTAWDDSSDHVAYELHQ